MLLNRVGARRGSGRAGVRAPFSMAATAKGSARPSGAARRPGSTGGGGTKLSAAGGSSAAAGADPGAEAAADGGRGGVGGGAGSGGRGEGQGGVAMIAHPCGAGGYSPGPRRAEMGHLGDAVEAANAHNRIGEN